MTLNDFRQSLTAAEPPAGLTLALAGLWWDAKGDWTRAHESTQQDDGENGAWVHAYLHRKEGDQSNAAYWYRRASKPVCREPLDTEWLSIVIRIVGIDRPILSGLRIMTRHLMFFDSEPSMRAESIVVCRRAVVRPDHAED